jgi:hypothetical protein
MIKRKKEFSFSGSAMITVKGRKIKTMGGIDICGVDREGYCVIRVRERNKKMRERKRVSILNCQIILYYGMLHSFSYLLVYKFLP